MRNRLLIFVIVGGLVFGTSLKAQLSPGPLALPHTQLSGFTNCLNCHTWGSKDLSPKCLDCHTPIANRISTKTGFHGQLQDTNCLQCHSDHVGLEFEMISWDPSKTEFDHTLTGFELKGKHLGLACEKCHTKDFVLDEDVLKYAKQKQAKNVLNTTFLGLGSECSDCHADVHRQEFAAQKCQECHNEQDWLEIRKTFEHDTRTKYPLKGAHKKLDCEKCHKENQEAVGKFTVHRFSGLKFDLCTNCHKDEHAGAFGSNCVKCHTLNSFKIQDKAGAFNHNKTRFPLIGKHFKVDCKTCHTTKERFAVETAYDQCMDCHKDYHSGAFQKPNRDNSCDRCHSVRGFLPALFGSMEHAKTQFALDGAHLAQPCIFCHQKNEKMIYTWDPLSCEACHLSTHGKQFTKYRLDGQFCEGCHLTSAWDQLSFDHKTTRFSLSGKHADLKCERCHKAQNEVIQYENTELSCAGCHTDVHAKQFVERLCKDCHSTSNWKIPAFNHAVLTQFPLDGQHKDLTCGQCHKQDSKLNTIKFKPILHKCQDCHSFSDFRR